MDLSTTTASPFTTILLIDDSDKDRTYYAERLRIGIPDCTVLEARDGRSGLALYRSWRIDCIITELSLPDMSGFELLIEVVPQASQPAIAVVILTRVVSRSLCDLAMRRGAHASVVKRFTSGDELAQIIPKAIAWVGPHEKDCHKARA
jgi:DNA-binding NarL/FixJ family response regulator